MYYVLTEESSKLGPNNIYSGNFFELKGFVSGHIFLMLLFLFSFFSMKRNT